VPTCSNAKVPGSLAALIETLMLTRKRVRIPVPALPRIDALYSIIGFAIADGI
jgi:hypothetical protein